ncbi:MAG: F0F1 ATP synthase subunit A [Leeuwenhoekiella sp.]
MVKAYVRAALFTFLCAFSMTATAQEHAVHTGEEDAHYGEGDAVNTREEVKQFIGHHLKDSHYFTLFEDVESGYHLSLPLPVILWDEGLQVFSASQFHHGSEVAEVNGNYYSLYHNKIYRTNADGDVTIDEHGHPTQLKPLDFSITKNVVTMFIVGFIMFLLFRSLANNYKKRSIPKGIGRVLEPLVVYVRDEIAIPNIGEKKYRRFMGYLLSVFFFIWIANMLGLTPLGTNLTGSISVTFTLAAFTYLITQFSGNKDYWKHIFWMPGVHPVMKIFFIPIEILGTLTKPFALLIRLYANITAGHVVLFTLFGLITVMKTTMGGGAATGYGVFFFIMSLFITVIELLVAFLQAYIFTILSALFIGMAVADHDHDHHGEEADAEDVREEFV